MKKLQSLSFLATLAVVIGMISWGSVLNAQTTPSTAPDTASPQQTPQSQQTPNAQQPPSQAPDTAAPDSGSKAGSSTDTQTFSGTVVKQGNKYMLKDDSGKMYDIDHQSDVAKFEGKRVRVQGTLDANGKILVK